MPSDESAWFEQAKQAAIEFAAGIKAPVIGYAYQSEHTRGSGYFRTDRSAKFLDASELPLDRKNLKPQATKLRRMIAKMQKRGIRAEIYEI